MSVFIQKYLYSQGVTHRYLKMVFTRRGSQKVVVVLLIVAVVFSLISMAISFSLYHQARPGYQLVKPSSSLSMPSGKPRGNVGLVVLTPPQASP